MSYFKHLDWKDFFKHWDMDKSGQLEMGELVAMFMSQPFGMSEEVARVQAKIFLEMADEDLDGKVSYREFLRAVLSIE